MNKYFINEDLAKSAKEMNSFSDYRPNSATTEYNNESSIIPTSCLYSPEGIKSVQSGGYIHFRHNKGGNGCFVDGHAETSRTIHGGKPQLFIGYWSEDNRSYDPAYNK